MNSTLRETHHCYVGKGEEERCRPACFYLDTSKKAFEKSACELD